LLPKFLRHTGAGGVAYSSAVKINFAIARKLARIGQELARLEAD
jgi:hypothetical protein